MEGRFLFEQASIIACRLLPLPDIKTTSRVVSSCAGGMIGGGLSEGQVVQ